MSVSEMNDPIASMQQWSQIMPDFDKLEGMISWPSAEIFHFLLTRQLNAPAGPILEIGAYKGKSAVILAHHLRGKEKLDLVDVHPYLIVDLFKAYGDRAKLTICNSADLSTVWPDYAKRARQYRFIHTDASHTFSNVEDDLRHADFLLRDDGVVSVDDYENPNYPQVPLAVGASLYGANVDLAPFLVANNKLYLCRRALSKRMRAMVLNDLAPRLYKLFNLVIAVTDPDDRSPVALRAGEPSDGPIYGPELFGGFVENLRQA